MNQGAAVYPKATMKMSDRQWRFAQDVSLLISFAAVNGIKVTFGEVYRTQYQHDEYLRLGYTRAKRSKHQDRLAVDLNLFSREDKVMWSMDTDKIKSEFSFLGDYWESLTQGNKWGGNFKSFFDPTHFEGA